MSVGAEKYIIKDILYVEGVIRGRGTVCYKVHPVDNVNVDYVVKDSWVDTSRGEEEHDILVKLAGIRGIPVVVHHAVVSIDGFPDTTARFRGSLTTSSTCIAAGKTHTTYSCRDKVGVPLEIREHRRIVVKPCGRKLDEFPSLPAFVQILTDVTQSRCLLLLIYTEFLID